MRGVSVALRCELRISSTRKANVAVMGIAMSGADHAQQFSPRDQREDDDKRVQMHRFAHHFGSNEIPIDPGEDQISEPSRGPVGETLRGVLARPLHPLGIRQYWA